MIIRLVFASKIWLISGHNKPLIISIIIVTLLVFGFSTGGAVKVSDAKMLSGMHSIAVFLYLAFSSFVVADALIAASLCTLLWKSRTYFQSTNSLLSTLIMYSVHTGVLTCTCAFACLISYATMPNNLVFIGIYIVTGKLYLNALLAFLNARTLLRGDLPRIEIVQ